MSLLTLKMVLYSLIGVCNGPTLLLFLSEQTTKPKNKPKGAEVEPS